MRLSKKRRPVVVLDSNVWISAIIFGGKPAKLVSLAEQDAVVIALSDDIVREIRRILGYEKLRSVYAQAGTKRTELIGKILSIAHLVKPRKRVDVIKDDPSDDRVIECALAAKASHIVSGNEHLLRVGSYAGIVVISVKDFLREMKVG